MRVISGLFCVTMLLSASRSYANGVGFGTNHLPVIRQCELESTEDGQKLVLERGEPVCLLEGTGESRSTVYYKKKWWTIDSNCLPQITPGIRSYRQTTREFKWSDAAEHLEKEAKDEDDCLVKTWKLIIAGHCHLHRYDIDSALRLYKEASAVEPENLFTPPALHVMAQLYFYQEDYQQALSILTRLVSAFPEYSGKGRNLLFWTYPHKHPIIERTFAVDAHGATIKEKRTFLTDFFPKLNRLENIVKDSACRDDVAKALYEKALLFQELHDVFVYDTFRSYFDLYSSHSMAIHAQIVEQYRGSGWDDNSYYFLLRTKTHDWEGDDRGALTETVDFMQDFISRYPNSELKEEATRRLQKARERLAQLEAESTFDPRIYETELTGNPSGGRLRLLYLSRVNPERTLNYLLESKRGQWVDGPRPGHRDYFYHGSVAWGMSVDGAYALLSLMTVQSPNVLRKHRGQVLEFVMTHIDHFREPRSVSYKDELVYMRHDDYRVRDVALDVLQLLGTAEDVGLVEEIIRDVPEMGPERLSEDPRDRRELIVEKGTRILELIRQRTGTVE